jgi:hypothetical protein
VKLGKGTQFPLANEKNRLRSKGDLKKEDTARLLLNPCIDDPEEYFTYDDDGLIHPRINAEGMASEHAKISISVYALQRKTLVEERRITLNNLRSKVRQLGDLVNNHNVLTALAASQSQLAENRRQIHELRDEIKTMFAPKGQFLAMLRCWIRTAAARGDFRGLLQFKIDLTKLI